MWFGLSLATAFFYALHGLLGKLAQQETSLFATAFLSTLFALPYYLLLLWWLPLPRIDLLFFGYTSLSFACNVVALLLFLSALHESPLSLTFPTLALTPILMLFTTPLLVGEQVNLNGLIGILLIISGFFLLGGISIPSFVAFLKQERGVRKMFLVACIWSISANFDKLATIHSSPHIYMFSLTFLLTLAYLPIYLREKQKQISSQSFLILSLAGLALFSMGMTQMLAVRLTLPSLVIAIKRSGMLFSLLFDLWIFHENKVNRRILPVLLILSGIFWIAQNH